MYQENFADRHNSLSTAEKAEMLQALGYNDVEQLIAQTIPAEIRLEKDLELDAPLSEVQLLEKLQAMASKNKIAKSYIGSGYYNTHTPKVILRNILENPGWYTQYTPYQAEISQGRLESLLNYQTMVSELTGLPIANASLLDEATAAGEAMIMMMNLRSRQMVKDNVNTVLVDEKMWPQTHDVLITRAQPLGIELKIQSPGLSNGFLEFKSLMAFNPALTRHSPSLN